MLKCAAGTSLARTLAGIQTPAKICFAWLLQNKGDPKKANNEKGELILGKGQGHNVESLAAFVPLL